MQGVATVHEHAVVDSVLPGNLLEQGAVPVDVRGAGRVGLVADHGNEARPPPPGDVDTTSHLHLVT